MLCVTVNIDLPIRPGPAAFLFENRSHSPLATHDRRHRAGRGFWVRQRSVARVRCAFFDRRTSSLWQDHLHNFLLRPSLLTCHGVRVDVHGDVAVGVPHEGLHRLHIADIPRQRVTLHPSCQD